MVSASSVCPITPTCLRARPANPISLIVMFVISHLRCRPIQGARTVPGCLGWKALILPQLMRFPPGKAMMKAVEIDPLEQNLPLHPSPRDDHTPFPSPRTTTENILGGRNVRLKRPSPRPQARSGPGGGPPPLPPRRSPPWACRIRQMSPRPGRWSVRPPHAWPRGHGHHPRPCRS
jgi:hypothetical protein